MPKLKIGEYERYGSHRIYRGADGYAVIEKDETTPHRDAPWFVEKREAREHIDEWDAEFPEEVPQ